MHNENEDNLKLCGEEELEKVSETLWFREERVSD